MASRPFRFVHASDFHLEMPLSGVSEVPDHLREVFLDAAYSAARKVFETAVLEQAEFVVLSGDLLHPQRAGVQGPLLLVEQFARLAQQGIAVYWAGGEVDPPDAWPGAFSLPHNVHVLPRDRLGEFIHEKAGMPLARIVGRSRDGHRPIRPADFAPDPAGLFTVAVAHGEAGDCPDFRGHHQAPSADDRRGRENGTVPFDAAEMQARRIHYWALGGQHERVTLFHSPTAAHDPGSPQGRRPEEVGPHGCTLVQVDENGQVRIIPVTTDVLRWQREQVAIDATTSRDGLDALLRQRMQGAIETAGKVELAVTWKIAGDGPLMDQLRHGGLAGDLLGWLRSEFGFGSPAAWSVALEVESAADVPAAWYEQETILGDFLREMRQLEMNPAQPLELEAYLAESHLAGVLAAAAAAPDRAARQRMLHEATLLGADLLGGNQRSE